MAVTDSHDTPTDQAIANDAFYGGLNLKDFQEAYRVPGKIADVTVLRQVNLARTEINDELAPWKLIQETAGKTELEADQPLLYEEAVFARAYALLLPMLITLYFTDQADGMEDEMAQNEARFYARSQLYFNRLTGAAESGGLSIGVL